MTVGLISAVSLIARLQPRLTGFVMTSYHGYPTYFLAWEFAPMVARAKAPPG